MSALPRGPRDIGYAGLRMTADEYLALGETRERYELIDGIVVMSPSPSTRHQKLIRLIWKQIERALESHPGAEVFHDTDLRIGPVLVYQPDLMCYLPGRFASFPERLAVPPDLVVEVLSPSNKPLDLITKRADYERFGVGEYWIVDPDTLECRQLVRSGERFTEAAAGMELNCRSIPGLSVDLAAIRGAMSR
jgi:Uma2 family endonuclease